MILLAASLAWATDFELEIGKSIRSQTAGALIDETTFLYATDNAITSGARFRLMADNQRVALEVFGAADTFGWVNGRRPQRWGGIRALVGAGSRTPLVKTSVHGRLGLMAFDVRDVAESEAQPEDLATIGAEVRRFTRGRLQLLEGDLFFGRTLWAGQLRTRVGFPLSDTGVYATIGGSTSRFSAYEPGRLTQVTWALETSLLIRPFEAARKKR